MAQPRVPPFKFAGPFRGIQEAVAGRQIGPGFAKRAHNVSLVGGRIKPRPNDTFLNFNTIAGEIIRSMFVFRRANDDLVYVFKTIARTQLRLPFGPGTWFSYIEGRAGGAIRSLRSGRSPHAAQFVMVNRRLYIADGSEDVLVTDGESSIETTRAGIDPPTWRVSPSGVEEGGQISFDRQLAGTFFGGGGAFSQPGRYRYAFTYFSANDAVESNALFMVPPDLQTIAIGDRTIFFHDAGKAPTSARITHLRIYRQNVDLGEPFFRLISQFSVNTRSFLDFTEDEDVAFSSTTTGPYAPSRNGLPPRFTSKIAHYNDRMFYAGDDQPGVIHYSEFGEPAHVAPTNLLNVQGDDGFLVTGLSTFGGQLLVGKERGIHALAGTIAGPTNATDALGTSVDLPASTHVLFKTRATSGPSPQLGPTFVLAGEPTAFLYYATKQGLMVFNGVSTQNVTAEVIPTLWDAFWHRARHPEEAPNITFSIDRKEGILYLSNWSANVVTPEWPSGTDKDVREGPPLLAFHYRSGDWTTASMHNRFTDPPDLGGFEILPTCLGEGPDGLVGGFEKSFFNNIWIEESYLTRTAAILGGPGRKPQHMLYETHPMEIVPGHRLHIYRAKLRLARAKMSTNDDGLGIRVNLVRDGREVTGDGFKMAFGSPEVTRSMKIARSLDDIGFVFRRIKESQQGGFENGGIVGFDIDFELEGV